MGERDTVTTEGERFLDRFLDRIDRSAECWRGLGKWQANGVPLVQVQGRQWLVHRLAYHLLIAPLERAQRLHKACQGEGCVRPGPGHWELRHATAGAGRGRPEPPRGISSKGCDKDGVDVWQVSVYLGRDEYQGGKQVEQRVRVHGTLEEAIVKQQELLERRDQERRDQERRKLAAGVHGRTMAELLDRYFTAWQKTPRKGNLPAKITAYHRHRLIENLIKPRLGQRIPAEILPGQLADWYDELMERGYTTTDTVEELPVAGRCHLCGAEQRDVLRGSRPVMRRICETPGCDGVVLRRACGERRLRTVTKQHPPTSGSTMAELHAILRGAFRFGVQRGWLGMTENPMTFVERRTSSRHVKRRPPSPEEVREALQAAKHYHDPNLYPIVALGADTGARLGELVALRLSDFDTDACAVTIEEAVSEPPKAFGGLHIKDTKTHTKRTIAVHRQTLRIILDHLDRCRDLAERAGVEFPSDPFAFPAFLGRRQVIAPGQPTPPKKMSKAVSKFFREVGIEATAKSLRAFVVTNWRKARVPDDVLRGRVGHDEATPVTDRHYHYREAVADRQETDELVGKLLYQQDGEDPPPAATIVSSLRSGRDAVWVSSTHSTEHHSGFAHLVL